MSKETNLCSMCRLNALGKCQGIGIITDENGFLSTWGVSLARQQGKDVVGIGDFIHRICSKNQITLEEFKKLR